MGHMNGRLHISEMPDPRYAFDEAVRRLMMESSQYGVLADVFVTLRGFFEEELDRPIEQ